MWIRARDRAFLREVADIRARHALRSVGGHAHRPTGGHDARCARDGPRRCGLRQPEIHNRRVNRPVVSTGPSGDPSIRLGARVLWRASSRRTQVASDVVWSRAGDAVAFATRDGAGRMRLVVVMVGGDLHGQVVSFAIPARPDAARRPHVIWLADQRVLVGASELEPTLVASWKVASR